MQNALVTDSFSGHQWNMQVRQQQFALATDNTTTFAIHCRWSIFQSLFKALWMQKKIFHSGFLGASRSVIVSKIKSTEQLVQIVNEPISHPLEPNYIYYHLRRDMSPKGYGTNSRSFSHAPSIISGQCSATSVLLALTLEVFWYWKWMVRQQNLPNRGRTVLFLSTRNF